MTERKAGDVRQATLVRRDEPPALALDRIRAGLIVGLAGGELAALGVQAYVKGLPEGSAFEDLGFAPADDARLIRGPRDDRRRIHGRRRFAAVRLRDVRRERVPDRLVAAERLAATRALRAVCPLRLCRACDRIACATAGGSVLGRGSPNRYGQPPPKRQARNGSMSKKSTAVEQFTSAVQMLPPQ